MAFFHGEYSEFLAVLFALSISAIITFSIKRVINIEAFIGLLYAFSAGSVMIVLSHTTQGLEAFKALIANDILFITVDLVVQHMLFYIVIGMVIVFVYPKLKSSIKNVLFFTLFALGVSSSVQLIGVLSVFVLLIAPSFIALSLNRDSLVVTSVIGIVISSVALIASYHFDLPTGYTLVSIASFVGIVSGLSSRKLL